MNEKRVEKLMVGLLSVSTMLIFLGAIFKLQHYPHGELILWIGLMSSIILSSVEINRLKKIIKKLKGKAQQAD